MKKRMIIAVLALAVVFGGIFGYKAVVNHFVSQYFANFSEPASTVSTTEAKSESWQPRIDAVGALSAVRGVDVSNEVAGKVESINFESGQKVEKGDLIVQLDDSTEQAQLPGKKAQLKLARTNLERTRRLVERKLTATENLDTVQSELDQAESAVAELKAIIAKKAIRAPFDGTLGIRQVNEGEFLPAGTNIVTLQALDPLHADFTLPEQYLDRVQADQQVELSVATWPGRKFTGHINAVSVKVDPSSHNFSVQATVDNPEHVLKPGLFADVEVLAGEPEQLVVVPKPAVTYSLYGDAVYVVTEEGKDDQGNPILKAHQRFVRVGRSQGEWVAVTEGLEPGDRVVTAGQLKLHDGSPVKINNEVAVVDEPAAGGGGEQGNNAAAQ